MTKTAMGVAAVVLALAGFSAAIASAQQVVKKGDNVVEVTVTGQGMEESDAKNDGFRKAIEAGAGTFISSQSEVKDFALVRDTVLSRSAGFVQSHEIISTAKAEDGVISLKMKVVVSVKGIEDVWGTVRSLLERMGRPKIMVFINEKIGRDPVEESTVQTRIQDVLLKSGFQLVDRDQLKEIDKKDLAAAVAEDKPDKVQAIAKRFGAQMFISGTANAARGDDKIIGGVHYATYEAEANVKCYRTDTAELMASVPGAATRGVQEVAHSAAKQALDAQAQQVTPLVRDDILRFWMEAVGGRGEMKIEIEGIKFAQIDDVEKALKTVKEIKDVNTDFANNIATCSIQCEGTAKDLAKKIAKAVPQLEISDVTNNVIKAKFVKAE